LLIITAIAKTTDWQRLSEGFVPIRRKEVENDKAGMVCALHLLIYDIDGSTGIRGTRYGKEG
jgi:hypothetical protein